MTSVAFAGPRQKRPLFGSISDDDKAAASAHAANSVSVASTKGIFNDLSKQNEFKAIAERVRQVNAGVTTRIDENTVLAEAEDRDPEGYICMNKVMLIKEVEWDEEVRCNHVTHESCHKV